MKKTADTMYQLSGKSGYQMGRRKISMFMVSKNVYALSLPKDSSASILHYVSSVGQKRLDYWSAFSNILHTHSHTYPPHRCVLAINSAYTTAQNKAANLAQSWRNPFGSMGMYYPLQSRKRSPVLAVFNAGVLRYVRERVTMAYECGIPIGGHYLRLAWKYCCCGYLSSTFDSASALFGSYPAIMPIIHHDSTTNCGWSDVTAYCSWTELSTQSLRGSYMDKLARIMEHTIWSVD